MKPGKCVWLIVALAWSIGGDKPVDTFICGAIFYNELNYDLERKLRQAKELGSGNLSRLLKKEENEGLLYLKSLNLD